MTRKEKNQLRVFPKALDQAVTDKFGVECSTFYDFFGSMKHITYFETEDPDLKARIELFIEAWIMGNDELATRMENPNLFL